MQERVNSCDGTGCGLWLVRSAWCTFAFQRMCERLCYVMVYVYPM